MHLSFDLPLLFCLYNLQDKLQLRKAQSVSTVPVIGLSTLNHISFLQQLYKVHFFFDKEIETHKDSRSYNL